MKWPFYFIFTKKLVARILLNMTSLETRSPLSVCKRLRGQMCIFIDVFGEGIENKSYKEG
ncbi:hypothetical protein BTS2_2900 [Bacillus sp. TS-2]|nr:hypothetical protein BTS2_2900 [Bacillus sp. TS-2]